MSEYQIPEMRKISGIYARQSKDKKDSVSIETQIEKCINLCKMKGKEYKIYRDKGYSGKDTDRPDYGEVMDDIKAGILDEVVVYKLDRISRNLNDFTNMISEFDKYGVSFSSANEYFDTASAMGRAMMYLLMVFAQLERETTAERIKDNAMYRASLGRWTGGPVPFGYTRHRIDDNNKAKSLLGINEEEAKIIKEFTEWYLDPTGSVRSVVFKANLLGLSTKDGSEWSSRAVSRILQNVLYATNTPEIYDYFNNSNHNLTIYNDINDFDGKHGMMYYRKRGEEIKIKRGQKPQEQFVIIGEHQGIIPGSEWVKIQQKLDHNKKKAPRALTGKLSFLSGIVKCGVCGSPMIVTWSGNPRHEYMRCRRKEMNGKFLCANKSIRVDVLEKIVFDKLKEICNNKKFIEELISQANEFEQQSIEPLLEKKSIIQKKIKENENDISSLVNNFKTVQNKFATKHIEKEIEKISKNIDYLKKELKEIDSQIDFEKSILINKQYLIDNYNVFIKQFEESSLEDKQIQIRGLIRDIFIDKGNITINFF